ncbi:uncharacterized protein LOC143753995 [Siphateles boraxobius]|uniref:uncharacterized protein LOC143753995 n=1 Tax=Siphateles boraxobius TaxID=180520 RepID=UPI00406378F9
MVRDIICNLVASLLLLSLNVSGTTKRSEEQQCAQRIKVPRNTVFRALVMTELKINCTLTQHGCHRSPRVSWCKIYGNDCKAFNHSDYIKTEWKYMTEVEGMAFLIFLNISMEDAGLYRCKEGDSSVSHAINVTVTDNNLIFLADKQDEFSLTPSITSMAITTHDIISSMPKIIGDMNTSPNEDLQWLWPYVYICTGIAGLVFIVMVITLLNVVRCQGRKSTGKDMACKNQNIKTQKSDLLLPPHLCLNSDLLTSVIYRV